MNALKSYYSTNYIKKQAAFTIVELLIVVVVIAILAAVAIVSYNGITARATETALKSDLQTAATQLGLAQAENGFYPSPNLPGDVKSSDNTTFEYTSNGQTFCLSAFPSNSNVSPYHITNDGTVAESACSGHTGEGGDGAIGNSIIMQTITTENCPTTRTRAVDARDNHTYWVQKLADGKCWMLTNLAYAGGGTNTYGDIKTLQNGASDTDATYVEPKYYVPTNANSTSEPTSPSVSTDGGITNPQYGYRYNWCAAMGAQLGTLACAYAMSPVANDTVSVCPANWRLPTGGVGGEFAALNDAVNGGLVNTDAGLRLNWLVQWSIYWSDEESSEDGYEGAYWSSTSTQWGGSTADMLSIGVYDGETLVYPSYIYYAKSEYFNVRCVAL